MTEGDADQYGFDCPNCGDTTVIETENGPEALINRIYKCDGCGENILMSGYQGGKTDTDSEHPGGGEGVE